MSFGTFNQGKRYNLIPFAGKTARHDGFYGFPDCRACECSGAGVEESLTERATVAGACQCRVRVALIEHGLR